MLVGSEGLQEKVVTGQHGLKYGVGFQPLDLLLKKNPLVIKTELRGFDLNQPEKS